MPIEPSKRYYRTEEDTEELCNCIVKVLSGGGKKRLAEIMRCDSKLAQLESEDVMSLLSKLRTKGRVHELRENGIKYYEL